MNEQELLRGLYVYTDVISVMIKVDWQIVVPPSPRLSQAADVTTDRQLNALPSSSRRLPLSFVLSIKTSKT